MLLAPRWLALPLEHGALPALESVALWQSIAAREVRCECPDAGGVHASSPGRPSLALPSGTPLALERSAASTSATGMACA